MPRPGRKCFQKLLGVNMCLVSPIVIGLGIADVILSYLYYCSKNNLCSPLTNSLVLTWVGIGVWAPILTLFNGILAFKWAGRDPRKDVLCVLGFLSTFIFMPALVVVTALELKYKFPSVPSDTTLQALFGIEIAIAVLGAVLMLHALVLTFLNCCINECRDKSVKNKEPAKTDQSTPQQPQQERYQAPGLFLAQGQYLPQGQLQPQPLQRSVQQPLPAAYRLGYYQSGIAANPISRFGNGGNYQIPAGMIAGARW